MGHYFFHLKDNDVLIPDPEGDELPDDRAALKLVRETVLDILRLPQAYGDFHRWAPVRFVVADESGRTVLDISVDEVASELKASS